MAQVSCTECQKEIDDEEPTCPHCGVKREKPAFNFFVATGPLVLSIAALLQILSSCQRSV